MSMAFRNSLVAKPFFAGDRNSQDAQLIAPAILTSGDLSFSRIRRDEPGFGITTSNPIIQKLMVIVLLNETPEYDMYRDGKSFRFPAHEPRAISCLDWRDSWVADLSHPFHSFNFLFPITAFDKLTEETGYPKIEQLDLLTERTDETMFHLAMALSPLLEKPDEAMQLFTDQMFGAMLTHLAFKYGGLDRANVKSSIRAHRGRLTLSQERLVTEKLLDDISADPGLTELASMCGLSKGYFVRAFKASTGLPPHRWLSLQRAKRAKVLLQTTNTSISQIALECGFADQSHLTRVFSKAFDIGPGQWRRQSRH